MTLMLGLWLSLFMVQNPPCISPEIGRYQIIISTVNRQDAFLLDTVTGKVWRQTFKHGFIDPVWIPVPREDEVKD